MTHRSSRFQRARVDRLMPVHARMHLEDLGDEFTMRTMNAVRIANARKQQFTAPPAQRSPFTRAALALACFTFLASLAASFMTPAPQPATSTHIAMDDTAATTMTLPEINLRAAGTLVLNDNFVGPFREEAGALIDTGRDVGFAMLSALPAQPRAWSERLAGMPNR